MIGDEWARTTGPKIEPYTIKPYTITYTSNGPTTEEFEAFKEEMRVELLALKKLLIAAKIYDEETGQKDCEQEEKIALFKRLAELTGVDLSEIFG